MENTLGTNVALATETQKLTSHHISAVLRTVDGREKWDAQQLLAAVTECVAAARLTAVANVAYTFQPQGVSAVVVLEESHVAVHLWPERGRATVDIHVCDYSGDNEQKALHLAQLLGGRLSDSTDLSQWHRLTVSE
jgi:S-adenosylmethionine decarboxylase